MLEVTGLTQWYDGQTAIDSLNLTIERGEMFCPLGANGAGKTTTINLFLNFIPPTAGSASMNTVEIGHTDLERINLQHMKD
jgi:ABC-2 type transport system ATP-binding protein